MTRGERLEVALALEKLRAAEARLADAVQCGDTHDACVDARFACELKELGLAEQEPIALDLRNVL